MIVSFIIYFCALTSIGVYFYHKNKNATDFMLGDRSVNYWVTAVATQASDMGAWLFLGLPALVYTNGMSECWAAIGLIFFMFLNWHYVAPKLRALSEQQKSLTVTSFFADRVHDKTGIIKIVSALITLLFFTFYITSGLVGMGRLFASAFGINYFTGVLIGLAAATIYTLVGGFLAVAWCDFMQGIFLLVMIVVVPLTAFAQTDGWDIIKTTAFNNNISFSLKPTIKELLLAASWGLGYFGQPHILTNFMGIDDPKKIRYAKYVGISWQIIVLTSSALIGLVGLGYFGANFDAPELLFITMTQDLFTPIVAGFALCAILAATLSTMDSHILISGSVIAQDLYKALFNKNASPKKVMWLSRIASLVTAGIALAIATNNDSSVYNLVNYAWSGLGSAFGPLLLTTLYTQWVTKNGALAGIIVGAITSAVWPYFGYETLPLVPGFILSFATLVVVSKLLKK